jgi:hypothetical protein
LIITKNELADEQIEHEKISSYPLPFRFSRC